MEATDFLGNTLAVGDKVVYARLGYRKLKTGYVRRITPCMVFIANKQQITGFEVWNKQSHNQVIKI